MCPQTWSGHKNRGTQVALYLLNKSQSIPHNGVLRCPHETKKNIFHKTGHTFFPLCCFTHTQMLQLNELMASTLCLSSLWEGMPNMSSKHSENSDITLPLAWGKFLLYKQTLFQQRDAPMD